MSFVQQHLREAAAILERLDVAAVERMVTVLARLKSGGGRLFFLGVGGSAANCSHAVNDFRKLVGMECYAPTDNVAELTARINDDGWESSFVGWLKVSRLRWPAISPAVAASMSMVSTLPSRTTCWPST